MLLVISLQQLAFDKRHGHDILHRINRLGARVTAAQSIRQDYNFAPEGAIS